MMTADTSEHDATYMRMALAKAREGIARGQQPFGGCVVRHGTVLACLYNSVHESGDITAHPEINAVREACRTLGTLDLSGCVLYATCEPCPMCFTAAHMARVDRILYGVSLAEARQYGFGRFPVSNTVLKELAHSPVEVIGGFLREESMALLQAWAEQHAAKREEARG
jgi:tRNA(Arg) A34 adenosine deaminase TadA